MGLNIGFGGQLSIIAGSILLILTAFPQGAYADIGMDLVSYYYIISNIKDYPDYEFIARHDCHFGPSAEIIDKTKGLIRVPRDGCAPYFMNTSICAIRAIDFNKPYFQINPKKYIKNNPNIIFSNIHGLQNGYIKNYDQVHHVNFYLKVESITDKFLTISGVKIVNYYHDGNTSEMSSPEKDVYFKRIGIFSAGAEPNKNSKMQKVYSDNLSDSKETKNNSPKINESQIMPDTSLNTWFFGLPLIAILIISFILLRKRKKH